MFTNRTSKLAAAVALNILADALGDRQQARAEAAQQPLVVPGNVPLGFIEYSRSEHLHSDDFRAINNMRVAITAVERALPYDHRDVHLNALKQLLRDVNDNARQESWAAVSICTGVMCLPGQTREAVKVVYVLADGSTRSATWFKQ